jgi:hypothetical protein
LYADFADTFLAGHWMRAFLLLLNIPNCASSSSHVNESITANREARKFVHRTTTGTDEIEISWHFSMPCGFRQFSRKWIAFD